MDLQPDGSPTLVSLLAEYGAWERQRAGLLAAEERGESVAFADSDEDAVHLLREFAAQVATPVAPLGQSGVPPDRDELWERRREADARFVAAVLADFAVEARRRFPSATHVVWELDEDELSGPFLRVAQVRAGDVVLADSDHDSESLDQLVQDSAADDLRYLPRFEPTYLDWERMLTVELEVGEDGVVRTFWERRR